MGSRNNKQHRTRQKSQQDMTGPTTTTTTNSPLLNRPQQEQQQIIHHHHHHHFNDEYISPTYTSTPLFKPEISPYDQPKHPPHSRHAWGTHIHQYAGIGNLTFLGS